MEITKIKEDGEVEYYECQFQHWLIKYANHKKLYPHSPNILEIDNIHNNFFIKEHPFDRINFLHLITDLLGALIRINPKIYDSTMNKLCRLEKFLKNVAIFDGEVKIINHISTPYLHRFNLIKYLNLPYVF